MPTVSTDSSKVTDPLAVKSEAELANLGDQPICLDPNRLKEIYTVLRSALDSNNIREVKSAVTLLARTGQDLEMPFKDACALGNIDIMKIFLDAGVDAHGWCGETHSIAARGGHLPALKFLLALSDKPQSSFALAAAAGADQLEIVKHLLPLNDPGEHHRALRNAAESGHLTVLDYLLSHKCKDGSIGPGAELAMDDAMVHGHIAVAKRLINFGVRDIRLHRAVDCNQFTLVKAFLEDDSILERITQADLDRALVAAASKSVEFSKILLAKGANPNALEGRAFIEASQEGNLKVLELYIHHGVNLATYGAAALESSASAGHQDVVEMLITHAELAPSLHRGLGRTVSTGNFEISRVLIHAGADVKQVRHFKPLAKNVHAVVLLELSRSIQSCEYDGAIAKVNLGERLELDHQSLSNDSFDSRESFTRQPIVRVALHAASVAAILFPTDYDSAHAAMCQLVKQDVRRINSTPALSWRRYIADLDKRMSGIEMLTDLINEIAECVILPKIPDGPTLTRMPQIKPLLKSAKHAAALAVISEKSTLDFAGFNYRWHRPGNQVPPLLRPLTQMGEWHPLFAPQHMSNGATIVGLRTPAELEAEGEAMEHCVAGYATACQRGDSHVLSVRENGNSIATIALSPVKEAGAKTIHIDGLGSFRVHQFKGLKNQAPPLNATQAFNELKDLLEKNKIEITKEIGVTDHSIKRKGKFSAFERTIGFPTASLERSLKQILEHYKQKVIVTRGNGIVVPLFAQQMS